MRTIKSLTTKWRFLSANYEHYHSILRQQPIPISNLWFGATIYVSFLTSLTPYDVMCQDIDIIGGNLVSDNCQELWLSILRPTPATQNTIKYPQYSCNITPQVVSHWYSENLNFHTVSIFRSRQLKLFRPLVMQSSIQTAKKKMLKIFIASTV